MRGVFLAVAVLALAPGGVEAQRARVDQTTPAAEIDNGVAPLVDASGLLYDAVPPPAAPTGRRRDMAAGAPRVVARDGQSTIVTTSVGDDAAAQAIRRSVTRRRARR